MWLHLLAHQSQPHDHKSKTSERQGVWALQTKPVVLQGLGQEVSDQLPFPSPGQLRLQLKKPGVPLASGRQSMHHAVTHHLNHHHRVTFTDFAEQLLAVRSCYPTPACAPQGPLLLGRLLCTAWQAAAGQVHCLCRSALSAHQALGPLPCLSRGACCTGASAAPGMALSHHQCSQTASSSPSSWHPSFSNSLALSEKAMISVGLQAVEQSSVIVWQATPQTAADQQLEA